MRLGRRHNLKEFGRISQSSEKFKTMSLKHYELPYFWLSFTYFGKYNLLYTVAGERGGQWRAWSWKIGMVKKRSKDDEQVTSTLSHVDFCFNYLCLKLLSTSWADYLLTLFQLTNANKIQLRHSFSFFIPVLHFASTLHKIVQTWHLLVPFRVFGCSERDQSWTQHPSGILQG